MQQLRDRNGRFMKAQGLNEDDWGLSPTAVREISGPIVIVERITNQYYVLWAVSTLIGMAAMLLLGVTLF